MATLVEVFLNDSLPELLVVDPALVAIDHHVPRITALVERSQTLKYKPSSIVKLLPELEKNKVVKLTASFPHWLKASASSTQSCERTISRMRCGIIGSRSKLDMPR